MRSVRSRQTKQVLQIRARRDSAGRVALQVTVRGHVATGVLAIAAAVVALVLALAR
jgi:hypothetical protein